VIGVCLLVLTELYNVAEGMRTVSRNLGRTLLFCPEWRV
jgi:hypothetical protein